MYFGGAGGAPDFHRMPGAGPMRGSHLDPLGSVTDAGARLSEVLADRRPDPGGRIGGAGRGRVRDPGELPGGLPMGLGGNNGVLVRDPAPLGPGAEGPCGPAAPGSRVSGSDGSTTGSWVRVSLSALPS